MSDDKEYRETWFIVPSSILDLPDLSLGFLKVFETIFQFWNKGRKCYLSNPEISRRTGLKITQVKDAIAYFERQKELERIQIGMKRYLMQPLKVVEIPGLELVPKEVAAPAATCTIDTQVAAPAARGGRPSGQGVAAPAATEIKNINKEIKKPINKLSSFSLEEALKENPHNLSLELLEEWSAIRIRKHKSPLTARAWKRTNTVLGELIAKGLKLDDVIDRMLAQEWRGIEVSYFEKEIKSLNPSANRFPSQEEKARVEREIREREIKNQEEKKKEIESSKGFKERLSAGVNFKELARKQEEEMKKLGMDRVQYHAYIINKQA